MWHILGAGSLGGLWATRQVLAGNKCCLITRTQNSPINMTLETDGQLLTTELACCTPQTLSHSITRLIIATKTYQTPDAFVGIMDKVEAHADVILLQNGMGVAEQIEELRPDLHLLHAVSTDGAFRRSPHHVVHAGRGITWLGSRDDSDCNALIRDLQVPGLDIRPTDNIKQRLWEKLAINCAINGLTVMHDCRNGELLEKAETLSTMKQLCQEASEVMQHETGRPPEQSLFETAIKVAQRTANNTSSMLADVRAGRRTEIDYINGYLCKTAAQAGIPTPVNDWLTQTIQNRDKALL